MKKIKVGLLAAAAALIVAIPLSAAPSAIGVSVVGTTANTVTLTWTPPAGTASQHFLVNGKYVSWTRNATVDTATFSRNVACFGQPDCFQIQSQQVLDVGGSSGVREPDPQPTTNCLVSNFQNWEPEDCDYNTLIERTNQAWECTQPLSNYGPLPVKVIVHSTGPWNSGWGMSAGNGCVGDGNPDTVDLIGFVEGNGARSTRGVSEDAFKTRGADNGPRNIQITGRFECGPTAPGAHQDMVQFQGGTNVTLVGVSSGNWQQGLATCPGAGGVIYTNGGTNVNIVDSFFVGCNHGILGGNAQQNEVRDSGSRTSRTDGSDPNCPNSGGGSHPCGAGPTYVRTICQSWDAATDTWRNR